MSEETDRLPLYLFLSLLMHLTIGIILVTKTMDVRSAEGGTSGRTGRVMDRLLGEYKKKAELTGGRIPALTEEQALAVMAEVYPRLDFGHELTEKEEAEIIEEMLKNGMDPELESALQSTSESEKAEFLATWLDKTAQRFSGRGPVEIIDRGARGTFSVRKLETKNAALLENAEKDTYAATAKILTGGQTVLVPTGQGPKEVPAEYYFRRSPYRKMAALGGSLFAIINESRKTASGVGEAPRPSIPEEAREWTGRDDALVVFFLSARPVQSAGPDVRPPLKLGGPQIQTVLDGLMALEVPDQLEAFKKDYLDRYDWQAGDLALLAREFFFANLNGVFFLLGDLATAFDQAEELFYKRPVYDFFAGQAGLFPGTRTDSENRFYLASALDFELRTIKRIFSSKDEVDDVIKGTKKPASLFQPVAKALVLRAIREDLIRSASGLRIFPSAMIGWYLDKQQKILSGLEEIGGEIRNRALVMGGKLLWAEGDISGAVGKWTKTDRTALFPSRESRHIIDLIDSFGFNSEVRREIDIKLNNEDVYADRLNRHLQFHTWEKRSRRESR